MSSLFLIRKQTIKFLLRNPMSLRIFVLTGSRRFIFKKKNSSIGLRTTVIFKKKIHTFTEENILDDFESLEIVNVT